MPANMSDLVPDTGVLLPISDAQRADAAVTIADMFSDDRHAVAYFLAELGLAAHQDDGTFTATMEVRPDDNHSLGDWFAPIRARHPNPARVFMIARDDLDPHGRPRPPSADRPAGR